MFHCTTPWTVAHQAPLSMEFSRQEYWSGLPCPSAGALPDPGIDHTSPEAPALEGKFSTTEPPEKPVYIHNNTLKKDEIFIFSDWQ